MRPSFSGTLRGRLSALLVGVTLAGAAGCGEELDSVEKDQDAITGGWVNLDLINGWTNFNGFSNPPAIGMVNGVVTFRGAIKATNPTSPIAFTLNAAKFANFRPNPLNAFYVRTMMSGNSGGTLFYNPFVNGTPVTHTVSVYQDGVGTSTVGSAAKAFTSLDGVAFDKVAGSAIGYDMNVWSSTYGFRQSLDGCSGCGVYGKQVDGFARFQGLLSKLDPNDTSGYLFTLTNSQLIPGNTVTVPAHLGGQNIMSFGALTIYPTGDVYVNGNPFAANNSTSFEGVWFSKTLSGNVTLPLNTGAGWHAYSARSVKVGKYGDVVRFQGAISGGNSTQIATLPAGYWPTKPVKLVGVANGPVPVTIVVNTNGAMTFEGIPTNVASLFLSLDGVSFGL
jgi:hypothetical protein